ncbi:Ppx/GppA phosphatase family protein [Fodinicurvata fenggangensis]|uniref:Ppx/GppA phosphatase family protein n=1 Tax=Fodinicurvata fenggangensis TaxID=1121830 RepID=UPI000A760FF0|nr:Ppx/GppA phosphatase family protein [Fodinicurvata fenggangensis]
MPVQKEASKHAATDSSGQQHSSASMAPRDGRTASTAPLYAALDLGTNNCRLLIVRACEDGYRVVDTFSRIVRLGEGLGRNGRLSEAAMARTISALQVCAEKLKYRGVRHLRAVATEACRRAGNCDAFLKRVQQETGLDLEIITSEEEACLALQGCAPLLASDCPDALVFDIGGGSTELSWLTCCGNTLVKNGALATGNLRAWHSLPMGVVTLAEKYGGKDIESPVYEAMVAEALEALHGFEAIAGLQSLADQGNLQFLGTSGTVTTMAGVYLDLHRYQRHKVDGLYMSADTARAVIRAICRMPYQARVAHPCIGVQRADLVIAGCAILDAFLRTWPVERLRVADRGVREGILAGLIAQGQGVAVSQDLLSAAKAAE